MADRAHASLLPDDDEDRVSPEAEELLRRIEDMQNSDDYRWAADTLEGIHATVSRTGKVTPGQQRAVENIAGSREMNRHTGRMSRRYR